MKRQQDLSVLVLFAIVVAVSGAAFPDQEQWTRLDVQFSKADTAPAQMDTAMVEVPGGLFIFGGSAGQLGPANDFTFQFSFAGVNWNRLFPTTIPPARALHTANYVSSSNTVFIFFGTDIQTPTVLGDVWKFPLATGDWINVQAAANGTTPAARFGQQTVGLSSTTTIFLTGGTDGTNFFNDVWQFDATNNEWTNLFANQVASSTVPEGRAKFLGAFFFQQIWFGFGLGSSTLTDMWRFDPVAKTWTKATDAGMDTNPRIGGRLTVDDVNNVAVVTGGSTDAAYSTDKLIKQVFAIRRQADNSFAWTATTYNVELSNLFFGNLPYYSGSSLTSSGGVFHQFSGFWVTVTSDVYDFKLVFRPANSAIQTGFSIFAIFASFLLLL